MKTNERKKSRKRNESSTISIIDITFLQYLINWLAAKQRNLRVNVTNRWNDANETHARTHIIMQTCREPWVQCLCQLRFIYFSPLNYGSIFFIFWISSQTDNWPNVCNLSRNIVANYDDYSFRNENCMKPKINKKKNFV